jgi:hypothetical protein
VAAHAPHAYSYAELLLAKNYHKNRLLFIGTGMMSLVGLWKIVWQTPFYKGCQDSYMKNAGKRSSNFMGKNGNFF